MGYNPLYVVNCDNTGLRARDSSGGFYLVFKPGSALTAGRTFTITTGDADRVLTLAGDATISGTNTGDQTNIAGNAATATALATPRNINGVAFNGTADITVTAAGSTLSDTVPIGKGGTGQITAQAAIDALTQVAGGGNEQVLTKDTASGNALWKDVPGGGGGLSQPQVMARGVFGGPF